MVMESSPKNGDSVLRMLPLCKGIILGVIIGVLYCLSMQDSASLIGGRVIVPGYGKSGFTASNLTTTSESNYSNWLANDAYGPPLASEVERIRWILALWEASPLLNNSRNASDPLVQQARSKLGHLRLPPPHLEDCAARAEEYKRLDSRSLNGSRPLWSLWKGLFGTIEHEQNVQVENSEDIVGDKELKSGPLPPWVEGGDEDNLPMTRRVQRDIWLLQHPLNCSYESVRFLLADWPASAHLGLGAQLVYVGGLLAIAMSEKRVLVLEKLDRADHQGCQSS